MSYILKIVRDESPSNPWIEWDTEPPLFYTAGRWSRPTSYGFENENPIESLLEHITIYREETENLEPTVETIEKLAKAAGMYCHRWESRGYSQGDFADCIVVLTPEFLKRVGTTEEHFKSMCEGAQKLFDAYMWGDVYGFQLIDKQPLYREDGSLSDKTDDIVMDSCYGFYGDDGLDQIEQHLPDEHKHLLEEARKNIS